MFWEFMDDKERDNQGIDIKPMLFEAEIEGTGTTGQKARKSAFLKLAY